MTGLTEDDIAQTPVQAPDAAPATAPAKPMRPAPRLATIHSANGQTAQVNADYAYRFQGLINDLEAAGYKIHSLSGFVRRNVAGTDEPSYHSDALALDVNGDTNPQGGKGDIPPELARTLAHRWGFGWGGDFQHAKPDPMHFSLAAHEGGVVDISPSGKTTLGAGAPAGLTPEQAKAWEDLYNLPEPTTPEGQKPGPGRIRDEGIDVPLTAAQAKVARGVDPNADLGSDKHPYFLAPGRPLPTRPGSVYVDFDGGKHTVDSSLAQAGKYFGGALAQGAIFDPAASANRVTGGGFGVPSAQPGFIPTGALAEIESPGINRATAQGALEATRQQQNDYAITHADDPYAGALRFGGQMVPSIGAAVLAPEIRIPGAAGEGALGMAARFGSRVVTNAGKGAAATLPTVGTNDAPILPQVGAGALAGAVAPEVLNNAAGLGMKLSGLGRTAAPPEVIDLANLARDKYRLQLRAGQIEGAYNPNARYRDSSLLLQPGSGVYESSRGQAADFTRAAARTIGLDTPNLTPAAADTARRNIGSIFEDVASRTGVAADRQLLDDLDRVRSQARELGLDASQISALDRQIDKITEAAQRHGTVSGVIPGDVYQGWTSNGSSLSRIMDSDHAAFGNLAGDIRQALDDGIVRASAPEDVEALRNARFQWKNLMTLKPLIAKAGPEGLLSPGLLRGRVSAQFPDFAYGGGGDLGDLARIGHAFMIEAPNSGTIPRLGELFRGAGGTGVLGGLMTGVTTHDPAIGALTAASPFAFGAARAGNNALQGFMNDNPVARASLLGKGGKSEFSDALRNFGRTVAPAEAPLSALALHNMAFPPTTLPPPMSPAVGADAPAPAYVP